MTPFLIAAAGSLGAISRFVLDGHIKARYNHGFPWATFMINATGSLLLGFVSGLLLRHHGFAETEMIIGAGFCGGYTTFSTASFETVRLLERREYKRVLGNAAGGLTAAIVAAAAGFILGACL